MTARPQKTRRVELTAAEHREETGRQAARVNVDNQLSQARSQLASTGRFDPAAAAGGGGAAVRTGYSRLLRQLRSERSALARPESTRLGSLLDEANGLMSQVHSTADAVLDARVVALSADISAQRMGRLAASVAGTRTLTADDLVRLLRRRLVPDAADLDANADAGPSDSIADAPEQSQRPPASSQHGEAFLGAAGLRVWNSVLAPVAARCSLAFRPQASLVGLLVPGVETAGLGARRRTRTASSTAAGERSTHLPTARPLSVEEAAAAATAARGTDRQTQERILAVAHALADACSSGALPLHLFILDPGSFGRTVENLFYLSFLANEGVVRLFWQDGGAEGRTLMVEPAQGTEEDGTEELARPRHQMVCRLDHKAWQHSVGIYGTLSSVPHIVFPEGL